MSRSSSPWSFTGVFPSLLVRLRVNSFSEKRDSRAGALAGNAGCALSDSGLYIGDVYEDEFGLTAAGVGASGRSALD